MDVIPLTPSRPEWGFVCGRISVLEGRLVDKDFLLNLIRKERIDDIVVALQETLLRDYLAPGSAWSDFSALTDQCFYDQVISLRSDSPSPSTADLFLLPGDYLNLKNALTGQAEYPFSPALLSLDNVGAVAHRNLSDLPASFLGTMESLLGASGEVDESTVDVRLDGAYLRHLLAMGDELAVPLVAECVREGVLAYAVVVLWRAVRLGRNLRACVQELLPLGDLTPLLTELAGASESKTWPGVLGGPLGDLLAQALETAEDEQIPGFELFASNHVMSLAREGHGQVAGPERVFSFLYEIMTEMRNLKLAVCGRAARVDPELLRVRLRDGYG
jgi:vacuolar-type H+-ATPase subunit C/Vma6